MSRKKLKTLKKSYTPFGERIGVLLTTLHLNQGDFAKSLGISQEYLSKLMNKTGTGGGKVWRAIMRLYPEWADYLSLQKDTPPTKPYTQEPEHMLPRREHEAPDSGPGQMKLPELDRYRIVRVVMPEEGQRRRLHERLDEILNSGNVGLITAITCNIEEFARSAMKDRILESVGRKPDPSLRTESDPVESKPRQRQ